MVNVHFLAAALSSSVCPSSTTLVDTFSLNGSTWSACEDLTQPGGAIHLLTSDGERSEYFAKSHAAYQPKPDSEYYLPQTGLTKETVVHSAEDLLGVTLLSKNFTEITWELVESAVPPIRKMGGGGDSGTGVRTFVGSRGSVADTAFTDLGEDANLYGFPPLQSLVFNATNIANGGTPIVDIKRYLNASAVATGLVGGGTLPVVVFYFPLNPACNASRGRDDPLASASACNPYLPHSAARTRYWTMIAAPTPDMKGSREQGVWFRYQELECVGNTSSSSSSSSKCALVGRPQYFDTYWWSNQSAPMGGSGASGFYSTLLENREWWNAELAKEKMMDLQLPSPASTNGTWLRQQMTHNIVRSMITWHDTWGPRYGVTPGYGQTMQNGFQDVFTSIGAAALEIGAMPYARGLIDNQFSHYIRDDGMINYRGEEVAQSARMLTILAQFFSYSKDDDAATVDGDNVVTFMLKHFKRAKAVADWLIARRGTTLDFGRDDPRYGIPSGQNEGDDFNRVYFHQMKPLHYYPSAAEAYRAFAELGAVWTAIGATAKRNDVAEHGAMLLKFAPILYEDLHTSMNKTLNVTSDGDRCWDYLVDRARQDVEHQEACTFRAYPELFYSGALTEQQTRDILKAGLGRTQCGAGESDGSGNFLSVGSPGADTTMMFTHIPQGWPHGLLMHDLVEPFLLFFFTQSAHAAGRGTFVTPESNHLDRDSGTIAYASAGQGNVPLCLKWMLCFEEMETRTLWLAKATPRAWLAAGETMALEAHRVATRYGRLSFTMSAPSVAASAASSYTVLANVTLPLSFVDAPPPGGLRIRIRAPLEYAGKLSQVTLGGKAWGAFNAAEETVDIAANVLTKDLIASGLTTIVAIFGAGKAVPLRAARFDPAKRVVPLASAELRAEVDRITRETMPSDDDADAPQTVVAASTAPKCPSGTTLVDTFDRNGTMWSVCEDLQAPGGSIALVNAEEAIEWFTKGYAPYGTNVSDHEYYLGLNQSGIAGAETDLLGAKLLGESAKALTWSAVDAAVPPIRSSGQGGRWATNCAGIRCVCSL